MRHYAVIEIGSNAVRMILGEKEDDSTVKVLRSWSSHFRLGQEVFSKGNISESFQIQLCSILEKLLDQLEPYGACPLQVFGTSAFRDAKNRKEVLQTLERNCGILVHVLSGKEEASVLLEGLSAFLPKHSYKQVVADLGGGSLELSFLNKNFVFRQCSLNIGTLRLREFEPEHLETSELFQKTIGHLEDEAGHFLKNSDSETDLLLTGGNAKTLGRFYLQIHDPQLNSNPGAVEMVWLTFEEMVNHFISLSQETLQKSWKLRVHQAEVFHSALKLFLQLGKTFSARKVMIPFFGLKESLLLKSFNKDNSSDKPPKGWKINLPSDLHPTEIPFD